MKRRSESFDPADLPLPTWTCLRSTSQLEGLIKITNSISGYHSNVVTATGVQSSSPETRHENLMEYNYRLNHRQAIKHGLVSRDLLDYYELYCLENINSMRIKISLEPIHTDVHSIFDFQDTGERFGFKDNFLPTDFEDGMNFEIVDVEDVENYRCSHVRTQDECTKFEKELSDWTNNKNGKIKFDLWAAAWNISIQKMKQHKSQMLDIYPKNGAQLRKYFDSIIASANRKNTTASRKEELRFAIKSLRAPCSSSHPELHDTASFRALQHENRNFPTVVDASARTENLGNSNNSEKKIKRKITCTVCGHFKTYGIYGKYHTGPNLKCGVPEENKRKPFDKNYRCRLKCRKRTTHYHACDQDCCADNGD